MLADSSSCWMTLSVTKITADVVRTLGLHGMVLNVLETLFVGVQHLDVTDVLI